MKQTYLRIMQKKHQVNVLAGLKFNSNMRFFFIVSFIVAGMTSCLDLDVEPVFYSDAFIVSRAINGDTLYSVDGQVQCNLPIKRAYLTKENNQTEFPMHSISSNNIIFEYSTPAENYQPIVPTAANYGFKVVLTDSSQHYLTDAVSAKALKPFSIDSIYYYANEMSMIFDWPKVTDANYYYARIIRNDTIVFDSGLISSEFTSIKLNTNSSGWYNSRNIGSGDTLVFSAMAILGEGYIYNNYLEIQSISFSDYVPFVWGK